MSIEFVTSANKPYFDRYGSRLTESVIDYLPESVSLRIYCEASNEGLTLDDYRIESLSPRFEKIDLFEVAPLQNYLTHARPIVEEKMGIQVPENPEERSQNPAYSYRWDALTFGKKGLSIGHALLTSKADYVFWVDSDLVFFQQVSERLLTRLFRGDADIVYFGRKNFHSETGFIGFRIANPTCKEFAKQYNAQWENYLIFENDDGWTDCHAFDTVLSKMNAGKNLKALNLSWTDSGHVMAFSPLSMYFDHMKGDRKRTGGSNERQRYGLRRFSEPFWFWMWKMGLVN